MMKGLIKFKHYVSINKVLVLTTHLDVINYILQGEISEGRAIWIIQFLKYGVEIHPIKIVKGKDLCKILLADLSLK